MTDRTHLGEETLEREIIRPIRAGTSPMANSPGIPAQRPLSRLPIGHVSAIDQDHMCLQRILACSSWELRHWRTYREARGWIASGAAGVVISESGLPDGSWLDILRLVQQLPDPPKLVVSSRLPEEGIWAEVLNLGGWDVLATPFEAREVLHVVSVASSAREWKSTQTIAPQASRMLTRSLGRETQWSGGHPAWRHRGAIL